MYIHIIRAKKIPGSEAALIPICEQDFSPPLELPYGHARKPAPYPPSLTIFRNPMPISPFRAGADTL
jgi:hypothetical protein